MCLVPSAGAYTCLDCRASAALAVRLAARDFALEQIPEAFRAPFALAPHMERARGTAFHSLAAQPGGLGKTFLVLVGDSGAGKTTVAACIARAVGGAAEKSDDLVRRARGLRWYTAKQLGDARRATKLGTEPEELREAKRCAFLVLDELGAETETTDLREVLFERHARARVTVITTYLTASQMALRYDAGGARRLTEDAHAAIVEVRR